jgi:ubiquinone/menaquinone biosynthesis C-methylase UbiE
MAEPYHDIFGIKHKGRVEGRQSLAAFYQDETVARTYEEKRFGGGGGRLKHLLDVDILLAMAEPQTQRVLDLAAGTGRISRALHTMRSSGVDRFHQIVTADYSWVMLQEARDSARQQGHSLALVNADAFQLPYPSVSFDAVICLRFIRHLYPSARSQLYQTIWRILKPGGLLILDVCNHAKHKSHVATRGVYDELYTREQFVSEMTAHSFQVEQLVGLLYFTTRLLHLRRLGFSEGFLMRLVRGLEGHIRHIPCLLARAYLWMAKCRKPVE